MKIQDKIMINFTHLWATIRHKMVVLIMRFKIKFYPAPLCLI
jgi:hypothetical protein